MWRSCTTPARWRRTLRTDPSLFFDWETAGGVGGGGGDEKSYPNYGFVSRTAVRRYWINNRRTGTLSFFLSVFFFFLCVCIKTITSPTASHLITSCYLHSTISRSAENLIINRVENVMNEIITIPGDGEILLTCYLSLCRTERVIDRCDVLNITNHIKLGFSAWLTRR